MRRDVYQALADPTRRSIIELIAIQPMTPNNITEHFESTRQAISKHLRVLTQCELVKKQHLGREIYYSLDAWKIKEIDNWLEQFKQIWEKKFNQLDEILSKMKED